MKLNMILYLPWFYVCSNQFKHKRMAPENDGANIEISNPIYMKDYEDDDVADDFGLDTDKVIYLMICCVCP